MAVNLNGTGGWITTKALASGGAGEQNFQVTGSQIASATITASNFATGANLAGAYGVSNYGNATYG